jgi:hypothetical protein
VCDILQWEYKTFPQDIFSWLLQVLLVQSILLQKALHPWPQICRWIGFVNFGNYKVFSTRVLVVGKSKGGLLKSRPFMEGIPFVDVDYCQFSDWGIRNPPDSGGIHSFPKLMPKKCNFYSCPNVLVTEKGTRKHREALGGNHMQTTTKQKRSNT